MAFPPVPLYPIKLDSDRTLFLVYNTTETRLAVDNHPWSEEIEIEPTTASEIWADNGYGNISGELFYYDSVEKNYDGKIIKLKGCIRNIGGNQTRFNLAGTWVRSYVIAEHHNQLVNALIKIESFLKNINDRIELLEGEPTCADDFNCVSSTMDFDITPAVNCSDSVATYDINISGNYTTVTINFGDGNTSTSLTGTHTYPPNAKVDPVVTIENDNCLTILTPVDRITGGPWDVPSTPTLSIPLCTIPDLPDINIPSCSTPSITMTFPQIILPSICISLPSISVDMNVSVTVYPISVISANIPSVISFGPVSIPSVIYVSVPSLQMSLYVSVDMPSVISFEPVVFPTVSFEPVVFPTVSFEPVTFPTVSFEPVTFPVVSFGPIPALSVDWGEAPSIVVDWGECDCTITVTCAAPPAFAPDKTPLPFAAAMETFEDNTVVTIPTPQALGIPSQIRVVAPEFKNISVKHDLPQSIEVIAPNLPSIINIQGPDKPLPHEIKIIGEVPEHIRLDAHELPEAIKLDAADLPTTIVLDAVNLPNKITIDASDIPDKIQVVGIPSAIELKGHIPSEIFLKVPENIEVPLVYRGGPIPVQFDLTKLTDIDTEDTPCFAIIPCPKR
jgi:hypothetical protein